MALQKSDAEAGTTVGQKLVIIDAAGPMEQTSAALFAAAAAHPLLKGLMLPTSSLRCS